MKKNSPVERLYNGIIKENPTFVLVLGMCPTLAVTTAAINGIGMGLTTTVVLAMSNLFISLLRNIIPDKVRMPAYIVVVASFVTIVQLLLQGFIPVLYDALGIYIPLIVVNCIILGRAESYLRTVRLLLFSTELEWDLVLPFPLPFLQVSVNSLEQVLCLVSRLCQRLMNRLPFSF